MVPDDAVVPSEDVVMDASYDFMAVETFDDNDDSVDDCEVSDDADAVLSASILFALVMLSARVVLNVASPVDTFPSDAVRVDNALDNDDLRDSADLLCAGDIS